MRDGQEPASFTFGKLPESIAALVIFTEVHGYKDSGFYPIYELFRSAHIIFSDTAIYRKHSDIYRRGCVLQ